MLFRHPAGPVEQTTSRPERVRRVLEDLGPTFVKFGQVMSTRPDLIPRPYLRELEHLQERVPPFPGALARAIVQEEFGQPVEELFAEFSTEPLAAGSLGQVHEATVGGRNSRGREDSSAGGCARHRARSVVARPVGCAFGAEFPGDGGLRSGGAGRPIRPIDSPRAAVLARGADDGRVPPSVRRRRDSPHPEGALEPYLDAVLTIDFVDGCRINDRAGLTAYGLLPAQLAEHGAKVFLKMVFELGLFHATPPGNLRVLPMV